MRSARVALLALAASVAAACAGGIYPMKTEDREYHGMPRLEANPHFLGDSAQFGPVRILHLREVGLPDFALDIYPRQYGLEPLDSTAHYVFRVRIRHVMQGSQPAESKEIRGITRNGVAIYPKPTVSP